MLLSALLCFTKKERAGLCRIFTSYLKLKEKKNNLQLKLKSQSTGWVKKKHKSQDVCFSKMLRKNKKQVHL